MCHLQELYAKYKSKGLVILGFDVSDDKKIALDMLRSNGVTFPNILDASHAAVKVSFMDYRNGDCPTNYVIDREGKVVEGWCGNEEGHGQAKTAMKKAGGPLAEAIQQEWEAAARQSAGAVTAAAQRLFQAVRAADYNHDWTGTKDWQHFPAKGVGYTVDHNYPGWVRWVCQKFKANPITDVRLGRVFPGPDGSPAVHFELPLKDGEVLQGDLPFHWDSRKKQWIGWKGLDWHLHPPPAKGNKGQSLTK